jgi:hypothetical protein
MTEQTQQTAPVQTEQPTTPAEAQNTESQGSIPYDRFKQVNDARKQAEDRLKQYEEAERKRAEDEALKRGEFEKVINDLKPQAERAAQLEEALKGYLEAELVDVPAHMRDLVPAGDITTQLTWTRQAKAKGLFNRQPAPNTDAGATGDPKQALKLSDDEQTMARKLGLSADQYAKYKRS